MPNIKSAWKSMRTSREAHDRNQDVRTRVKTCRRELMDAVDKKDGEASALALREYCSILDKAAKKGVIKKNTATRRKARASNHVRALSKA